VASAQSNISIPGRSDRFYDWSIVATKQRLVNGVRRDGLSEVGSLHSSNEANESLWSEGGDKLTVPEGKHAKHRRFDKAWNTN